MTTTTSPVRTPDRRALVDQLLRRKGISRAGPSGIPLRERYSPCALSFAQQGLWLAVQLDPRSAAYNIPARLRIEGPLDIVAVASGMRAIVSRHEALRTGFAAIDGTPHQVVYPSLPLTVAAIDVSGLPDGDRERCAARIDRALTLGVFDLTRPPLLRVAVVKVNHEDHLLLFTIHHIVADAWSMGILLREFADHYEAHGAGRPAAPSPVVVQYPDFAEWQRARARGVVFERKLARWQDRLSGLPPTELPSAGGPPERRRAGAGGSEPLPSVPGLAAAVQAISERGRCTPFVTWVAAMAVWLHRYTGQRDIAIGAPIANRLHADLEGLVGCFVNPIVLRVRLDGNDRFDDVVRRVHEIVLDGFANQDVPFERVVAAVSAQPATGVSPLFRAACVFHSAPASRVQLPGLRIVSSGPASGPARFDLELNVWQSEDRLGGSLVYNAQLFDSPAAARMVCHLTTMLADAYHRPGRAVAELAFLNEAEQRQIARWNATRTACPAASVTTLIAEQVALTPTAPAVVAENRTWDYQALWACSGRIASALRRRGMGVGSRVALWTHRSPETVAAVLGVLRTGAAYLPLDTSFPAERLRRQVRDARVDLMVVDRDADALLSKEAPVLRLADAASFGAPTMEEGLDPSVDAADLAYVIYTSGSTGSPKGVMVTHGGLVNYLRWARDAYPAAGLATLFHSSLAFDLTVTSVLLPLITGGVIRIVPESDGLDGLVAAFCEGDLGFVKLTPSHLRALANLVEPTRFAGRTRAFVVGGEPLDAALVEWCLAVSPDLRLFNEYGPTETVVGCSVQVITSQRGWTDPVPVGGPISNTELYVVTAHGQIAPVEVAGELWIGGAGVARGYLDRADLTAERFVPDPFGTAAGARLYRSGDRARWRADGTLEHLGRRDHQVKIRGHRIELPEIEAALREQPGVVDAAVVPYEPSAAERGLVAYVVTGAGEAGIEALRVALRVTLPEAMIPAVFVVLPALPLTSSGKVDRHRLPAPAIALEGAQRGAEPRTAVEQVLAAIWSEVLGVEHVGADDNFFEHGGHSLLGTRVLARVRGACGVDLPLRALFEAPTLAGLAARVRSAMARPGDQPLPPIVPVARDRLIPLSFAQQRLWFLHHLDPGSGFLTVPLTVRVRGLASVPALRRSVVALQERHEVLRATFAFAQRELVQRVNSVAAIGLPTISLEALAADRRPEAARRLIDTEAQRPFDLARGPLFRASLVRLAPDDHILVATVHHAVSDGWSTGILTRDFGAFYAAAVAGEAAQLPPQSLQYADFAFWQRRSLPATVFDRQLEYWRGQLAGVSGEELFPAPPRRPRGSRRRGLESIMAGVPLTDAVKRASRRHDVTFFMFLVAAYQVVLHAESGQLLFAIGTDVAGRRDAVLESVVGCFVNQLVLRADLRGDPTFTSLLERVRTTVLGADEHQDLPFEQLVQALHPRRKAGRHPIFQASVVFENTPRGTLDIPGTALEPFGFATRETKSDVNLVLSEGSARLAARLEYDADLLHPAVASGLASKFKRVLEEGVATADLPISTLVQRLSETTRRSAR